MSTELSGGALFWARIIVIVGVAWVAANVVAEWGHHSPTIWPKTVTYDGDVAPSITCTEVNTPAKLVTKSSTKSFRWPKRIDMAATNPEARVRLAAGSAHPGESVDVVAADGSRRHLLSVPQNPCLVKRVTHSLRWIGAVIQIGFALLLLNIRWTRESFGFFLFALGFSPMTEASLNAISHAWGIMAQNLLNDITEGAGLYGLMLFCEGVAGAKMPVWRLTVAALAITATTCALVADLAFWNFGAATSRLWLAAQIIFATTAAVVILLIVLDAYPSSDEHRRAQARWICSGIIAGVPFYLTGYAMDNIQNTPNAVPGYVLDLLYMAVVLVPISVWYAESRHHVMDVGLFISRGAFYVVLVYLGFGVLNAIAASQQARLAHSSSVILVSLSVLLAVCFSPLRTVVTGLIGRYVPRGRFESLRALREYSRTLADCTTPGALDLAMVSVASQAHQIRCTALDCEHAVLAAAHQYGDAAHDDELMALARDKRVREALDSENDAIRLHHWRYPVVKRFRNEIQPLAAIVVDDPATPYQIFVAGPHVDGTDLDTEEIKGLQAFVGRAVACRSSIAIRGARLPAT